ncbi:MAG: LON peptidase substrate-binding domain-containing protein, partial [Actinobacteria bacterium]|nr:LON peptidase substrate-binding domain-containing protein [Actinomycetota bacterium]
MPDLAVDTLPLLPLTSGVVLPQMIVTLALETDEAKAAADAAISTDGQLLLVPRVDGRYATVGTVAKIENRGDLPSGVPAVIVRGVGRAVLGAAAPGTGAALWIHIEPVEEPAPTERARELAREYRGVVETILEKRAGARLAEVFSGITDPGAIADTAGYWPELSVERKIEVLETLNVETRLEKVLAWAKDALADLTVREEIQHNVAEGMDKAQRQFVLRQQLAAIQKELGEDGDGDAASEFRAKVAELDLPDTVRAAIE